MSKTGAWFVGCGVCRPSRWEGPVMDAPAALLAIRWLVRDTFRQAQASGIFWLMLGFSAIAVDLSRDRKHTVRFFQCVLAGWVAGAAGLLLALMWTAGSLPSFLDPAAVSVLLAKPVPRWSLLAGRYLGVLVFVAFQ